MEALLSWFHPELGQILPSKLIPLAEQTNLIIPVSYWVLRTACQQGVTWREAGIKSLPMAVNFSPNQFQQPNLISMVQEILTQTGLEPSLREIEITTQTLQDLCSLGVRISLDDFGTGYSSLTYLVKFPFQTLKIDQSFVQFLQEKQRDIAVLSIRVVAEGVETRSQLELLRSIGCEEVQGFWFSHPLKTEDATKLLLENSDGSLFINQGEF
jgi:EAL domain-containing protein (putative c-di-GMP-specific phosphodiesterase class I)